MRKLQIQIVLGCCLLAAAVFSWAQVMRKPGLWEMTNTLTWDKSPLPPGVTLPAGIPNPFAPIARTRQVCMTQEMIDKFGAPFAYSQAGEDCTVTNIVRKPTGMTAAMICTGRIAGHGTIESSWPDGSTAHGSAHFTGSMQMGPNSVPVEYTVVSSSTYKSPDCGSVKPLPMPAAK